MSDNTNNGFPVPEEPLTRLEQYLSAIAGVTSSSDIPEEPLTRIEAYLNKIIENGSGGSGFEPTDDQLAAMNSGITAEDVQQISTNESNISSLDSRTGFGTAVPNNTNINNMTTIGTYYISTYTNAGTMTNLPIVRSGRLIVSALNTSSNGRLVQIYYPTWNDAEIIGKYYMRQLPTNDGWSNWYEYGGTEIVPTPSP